jgi:hypothetical protein
MNYDAMTDMELLHYLDLYSTDPVIRRLVNFLSNTRGGLITDLEAAGMDSHTWQFETEWQSMYPGDYIQQLRQDISDLEQDLSVTKSDLEDVTEERNRLETRSVMDLIAEVQKERIVNREERYRAEKHAASVKEENDKLREQLGMWKILETE